ncbi:MAG: GHKL domain-containing protein [Clostridia bacterium]|nr:GHKL domain-containing protein [Clostridia bacterium]
MTDISIVLGHSPVLYAVLSAVNMLAILLYVILGANAVFRVQPGRNRILYAAAGILALIGGGLRPFAFSASLNAVRIWNVCTTLLPFVCVAFLYPKKSIFKAMLAAFSYEFVEAVKYVLLLLFFHYDNDDVNDPLELTLELALHIAVLLLLLWLTLRRTKKTMQPLSVTRMGATLYLLIVATLVVFTVSLALMGSAYTEEAHAQFAFTLLNIPLFAATVAYAVFSLSRSRQQEQNYKQQLAQQIRHYAMMEQMNEDLRAFRHDLPKMLRPFVAYAEGEQTEQAKEIAQMLSSFTAAQSVRYNTGNYRLDTVLFCQQQIAQKDNITINWTFGSVFPAEGIEPDDIYTIFPNALDNAIEACRKLEKPCEITVASRIRRNEVLVTIANPVARPVNAVNGVPQTDKADKRLHGYGFRSMKKAAAKYGDDNLDFLVEDGRFILRFNLKFKEDDDA